jgi:hypothetical protein
MGVPPSRKARKFIIRAQACQDEADRENQFFYHHGGIFLEKSLINSVIILSLIPE